MGRAQVITPTEYVGPVMELATARRGTFGTMEYLDPRRVNLRFEMPLAELIVDFYDHLKGRSSGYASLDYAFIGYRPATWSSSTSWSTASRWTR